MKKLCYSVVCLLSLIRLEGIAPSDVPIIKHAENRTDKRKAKIALCAIFQNEAEFLKEWIEYHRLIGVSHFYLYNNLSQDNYEEVLKPYISEGVVELFDVPFDSTLYYDGAKTHNTVQVTCYNHALKMAKKANKWLAAIDTDEFITLVKDKNLSSLLQHYRNSGLVIFWQLYGTSWVWDLLPGELMIEKLQWKFPNEYGENWQFKTIVRPLEAKEFADPHYCRMQEGCFSVTPDHERFRHGKRTEKIPVNLVRINHYTFRTEKFYHNVKKPRRANWGYVPTPEMEKERMEQSNSVHDPVMLRFVPDLKKQMKQ